MHHTLKELLTWSVTLLPPNNILERDSIEIVGIPKSVGDKALKEKTLIIERDTRQYISF